MWLWIILAAFTICNFVQATPEILENEYARENGSPDDSLFLYMDERSSKPNRDIEARRRSELDKNFMRFGRSDSYYSKNYDEGIEDIDDDDEFARSMRSHNKNDKFIRFGRAGNGDFFSFWRDPYVTRDARDLKEKNFIRFGRSVPVKRSRRSVEAVENFDEYKRANNRDMLRFGRGSRDMLRFGRGSRDMLRFGRGNKDMLRFGRNRDMLRFGRRDNYLRFGRNYNENQSDELKNRNFTSYNKEALIQPIYSGIEFLTQLASQMRHENKDETTTIG